MPLTENKKISIKSLRKALIKIRSKLLTAADGIKYTNYFEAAKFNGFEGSNTDFSNICAKDTISCGVLSNSSVSADINWKIIQELYRNYPEETKTLFPVGKEISDRYVWEGTEYENIWYVADYRKVYTEDGKDHDAMILQMKYATPNEKEFSAANSNNYVTSDIRTWLNSSTGFLSCFSNDFLSILQPVKVVTKAYGGNLNVTYDKIWLPSMSEMNRTYDAAYAASAAEEGEAYQIWKNLLGSSTPIDAFTKNSAQSIRSITDRSSAVYCRLRSAFLIDSRRCWYVFDGNDDYNCNAHDYMPCVAACPIF